MIKRLFTPQVFYDVDFEGGSGSTAIDDAPGHVEQFDVGADDDDVKEDEFPEYEFGPSDEDINANDDNEDDDTQGDGSDDSDNEADDDPDTAGEENTGEEDDSAGEDEDDQAVQVTPELLLRAGRLGVSEDQVALFSNYGAGALEAHLDSVEAISVSQGGGNQESGGEGDSGYEPPAAYEPQLSTDDYEEPLVNEFSGFSDHVNGQITQTHKIIENVAGAFMSHQHNQVEAVVNEQIDELAEIPGLGFEATLGAGTDGLVPKGSVADLNRQKVVQEISTMQQQRISNGQPPMTTKRAFTEAVKKVTGKDISETSKKVQKKAASRKANAKQKTGRKTQRPPRHTSQEARDKASLDAWSDLDD